MDLKSEFQKYLTELSLSSASVKKYSEQVPSYVKSIINKDIYSCNSVNDLLVILKNSRNNTDFIKTDNTGNHMYSAGLNHYFRFFSNININNFASAIALSFKDNHKARLDRLKKNSSKTVIKQTITNTFIRNPDVVAERLYLANGICEDCKQKAPFKRKSDGSPYLEVHHIKPLSEGGKDTLKNTVALCPNCHRKRHFG